MTTTIDLKILDERIRNYLPAHATPGSAGLDLRACTDTPTLIGPGETVLAGLGEREVALGHTVACIRVPGWAEAATSA